jgi:hypothetical protein
LSPAATALAALLKDELRRLMASMRPLRAAFGTGD